MKYINIKGDWDVRVKLVTQMVCLITKSILILSPCAGLSGINVPIIPVI